MSQTDNAKTATHYIQQKASGFTPRIGIVLGSGLSHFTDSIQIEHRFSYSELAGFKESTVVGHDGELILGKIQDVPVACLSGRPHYYEGVSNDEILTPMRTLRNLGCELYIATNASGSLSLDVGPGSLMAITDHINFQGRNPLVGPNNDAIGPRFLPMENTYDKDLRAHMHKCADELDIKLHDGVYVGVLGPSYETPTEIKMFQLFGGDCVGMSTVPEVIAARHCGLKVVVVAAITNFAVGLSDTIVTHDEALANAKTVEKDLQALVKQFIVTVSTQAEQ